MKKKYKVTFKEFGQEIGKNVPSFLPISFEFILQHALISDMEGLFRKVPDENLYDKNLQLLKAGKTLELNEIYEKEGGMHVITKIIKQYFKTVPNGFFNDEVYDILITINFIPGPYSTRKKVTALRILLIKILKKQNNTKYEILKELFNFLREMSRLSDAKMNSSNLAIIFSPNLIRTSDLYKNIQNCKAATSLLKVVIDNYEDIFVKSDQNNLEKEEMEAFDEMIGNKFKRNAKLNLVDFLVKLREFYKIKEDVLIQAKKDQRSTTKTNLKLRDTVFSTKNINFDKSKLQQLKNEELNMHTHSLPVVGGPKALKISEKHSKDDLSNNKTEKKEKKRKKFFGSRKQEKRQPKKKKKGFLSKVFRVSTSNNDDVDQLIEVDVGNVDFNDSDTSDEDDSDDE